MTEKVGFSRFTFLARAPCLTSWRRAQSRSVLSTFVLFLFGYGVYGGAQSSSVCFPITVFIVFRVLSYHRSCLDVPCLSFFAECTGGSAERSRGVLSYHRSCLDVPCLSFFAECTGERSITGCVLTSRVYRFSRSVRGSAVSPVVS